MDKIEQEMLEEPEEEFSVPEISSLRSSSSSSSVAPALASINSLSLSSPVLSITITLPDNGVSDPVSSLLVGESAEI